MKAPYSTLVRGAFCALFLTFLACLPIRAAVLFSYDASSATPDPTAQGWTKTQGTSAALSATAGALNGSPVWNITDAANGDGLDHTLYYVNAITATQDAGMAATGWSLSVSVTVPGTGTQGSSNNNTSLSLLSRYKPDGSLLSGANAWLYTVYFGSLNGKLQIRLGGYTNSGVLWTAETTDLVDVELRFLPGSGAVSLYANGESVVDDYLGLSGGTPTTLTMSWGKKNTPQVARTQSWGAVELQNDPGAFDGRSASARSRDGCGGLPLPAPSG